ncbi:hypothetical protein METBISCDRAFT_28486 [Metschnikowia bicuspidata]|uniref:Hap4 transcription factor heteromerisation domain-containing protein n=1 Tax=Metschnikowia bicuspidata TaxID=27322 RepID=A0A4V1J2N1_9ASCO|nr:hypothetical protein METBISCDRAFT_28486 [Metschnikowia bicuspidata]
MPFSSDRPVQPKLTITTSKNWVLPPRTKNIRDTKAALDKRKQKPASLDVPTGAKYKQLPHAPHAPRPAKTTYSGATLVALAFSNPTASPLTHVNLDSPDDLLMEMCTVERENYHLKTKLLLLIHDYKILKAQVMQPAVTDLYETASTARKRMFGEMGDPMSELITDLNGLSHASPAAAPEETTPLENNLFDYVKLEESSKDAFGQDLLEEELDDDANSEYLSPLMLPSSETDEHLLMSTLTRSTTLRLYDLVAYSKDHYAFLKSMSVIEDHYNQVADFLEENLLSNDVTYYVEMSHTVRLL